MTRFALLIALTLAWVGPANAQAVAFGASLSGAAENPSTGSPGTGSTTVFYDASAHTLRVVVQFSGLTAATTVAHIHCCTPAPGNAGVATTTPTFPGFPAGVTFGTYDNTFDLTLAGSWNASFITANGGTPAGAEAALAAALAAGTSYLNVHTSAFPSGEIRGFLAAVQAAPAVDAAIPTLTETSLVALIALVAAISLVAIRRRRA